MRTPSRRFVTTNLALLAVVLFAACTPTLGERGSPYRLSHDGPAAVRPGGEVFVQVDVPRDVFRVTRADLASRWNPWSGNRARASATHRFALRDVIAPDGWDVTLDRAVAYLRSTDRYAQVELLLRVTAPTDSRLGGQRVRALVVDQRGRSLPVEIVVQVGR